MKTNKHKHNKYFCNNSHNTYCHHTLNTLWDLSNTTTNVPQLSMSFSNQQTEINKLINWKQTASPSPNSCPKTIVRQTVRYATENRIKIKTKIPKWNQTSTHICPDHLSATERGKARQRVRERKRERESYFFSKQLLRELQTKSNLQALKLTTKFIWLSLFLVATGHWAMPK